MKFFFVTALLVLAGFSGNAQESNYYISRTFEQAVENGTRTHNGNPGKNYWINHADYRIDAEVTPETGLVDGTETITYYNDSPDTLKNLVIRLYQNIYKKGNARQFNIGNVDLTDGEQITQLKIDGKDYDVNSNRVNFSPTNMYVRLDKAIAPHAQAKLEIAWNFTLPQKRWIRFGQYSKDHLLAAYWYPQIAVYDDVDGWDRIEYAGMVEFYNDPNNFDVRITMPADFVVWSTAPLQNAKEVLKPEIYERLQSAKNSEALTHILTGEDYTHGAPTQPGSKHTWHFTSEKTPDFAFAASTGSRWDAVSLTVDHETGRKVLVSAVYPDSAAHYQDVAMIARNAIGYMSFELPGVPYPYPQATVFANGRKDGGMEFPGLVNDGAPDDYADLEGLTFHELFHSYFPFYMGTNERKYAFMDEGWARYVPTGFLKKYAPEDPYFSRTIKRYDGFGGSENELPPMIPTYIFNDYQTQRMAAYTRPATAYSLLRGMLGDALFKTAMDTYIAHWHQKHPMPYDFFNTFDEVSGEDLSWFWKPWFFERGSADLAIIGLTPDNVALVERKGRFPVPVELTVTFADGHQKKYEKDIRIWRDGRTIVAIPLETTGQVKKIELGSELIPDTDHSNNMLEIQPAD